MDVEGCDVQERNDDQLTEHRLALFAFASTDILIANVEANSLASRSSMFLDLVKAFLESGLKQGALERQIIYFVRDFEEEHHSKDEIKGRINEEIAKILNAIQGPPVFTDQLYQSLLKVTVITFPHPFYFPEGFTARLIEVRKMFCEPVIEGRPNPSYLFKGDPNSKTINYDYRRLWDIVRNSPNVAHMCHGLAIVFRAGVQGEKVSELTALVYAQTKQIETQAKQIVHQRQQIEGQTKQTEYLIKQIEGQTKQIAAHAKQIATQRQQIETQTKQIEDLKRKPASKRSNYVDPMYGQHGDFIRRYF
jgi:DNA repair exonuclease SbcCD ATPase subunit